MDPVRRIKERMLSKRIPPRLADALLTLGVALVSVPALAISAPVMRDQGIELSPLRLQLMGVLVVVQCLPLLLWRIRPVLSFVLAESVQLAIIVLVPETQALGLPPLLVAYSLGNRLAPARATALVGGAVVVQTVIGTIFATTTGAPALGSALNQLVLSGPALLLPMVLGSIARSRAITARLLGERVAKERERLVDDAIAEERRRIAGELHDVAAHHLSGMVVQAAAVERMIDRDPEAAKAGAAQLRKQGKETLTGLRSVVGLLRAEGDIAPVAGLRDLPELIASTRALGATTTFHCTGQTPQLAPIVDAAVYRIAQQALSNALQHAPGAAITIDLDVTAEELTMKICNGPAPRPKETGYRSGGTGTVVMAERASLIGAQLEAGPTASGDWRVVLQMPLASVRSVR